MLTYEAVQRWLDSYIQAWLSYDADAIGALFSEDASYAWHPWDTGDDVVVGRAAIVKAWLGNKDAPGSYGAQYAPFVVDGEAQTAVATGTSRYLNKAGEVTREFHNVFLMRFDDHGQCTSFVELFMQSPRRTA